MIQATIHSELQHSGPSAVESAGDAATEAIAKQCRRAGACAQPQSTQPKTCVCGPSLKGTVADFFRALVFRRCSRPCTSASFDRAVLMSQIGGVLLVLSALMPAVKPMVTPAPPEIAVIEAWMEDQYSGPVKISKYGAPQANPNGPGVALRVSYRYQTQSQKSVNTHQWFMIENNQVTGVDSEL